MNFLKVNLKTPVAGLTTMKKSGENILGILSGNSIIITFEKETDLIGLDKGQTLIFRRYIHGENGFMDTVTGFSNIINKDGNILTITEPSQDVYEIYSYYSASTLHGSHVVRLNAKHNVFLQDLNKQKAIFLDKDFLPLETEKNINIVFKREDVLATSADCITRTYKETECGSCEENEIKVYTYCPEKFSLTTFVVDNVPSNSVYVKFKYNPFYYINSNNECVLWNDEIKENYFNENEECITYVTDGESNVILGKNESYWGVNLGLSSDSNESSLGSDDSFNNDFVEDLTESLVPEIIDMERFKFSPIIKVNNSINIANSLVFNFHFRKRKELELSDIKKNSSFTRDNIYYDSWHIDNEKEETVWWNNFNYTGATFHQEKFNNFFEKSGKTSDLLGYLNFTDKDVYFRKKKVSKSFIRLSFYSSPDPIEQKLLYYSTVFLDGGELYGKYIKQLLAIEEGNIQGYSGNANYKVVLAQNGTPVDSRIIVTNEFNHTKSAEGFNIYLFADDHLKLNENSGRTIYMKVEFNHAGNGKTIPMIMWPKNEDNKYCSLTTENFIDSLYIPIELRYINGRYVYYIPDAINSDGNIELVLFEPKLDMLDSLYVPEDDEDNGNSGDGGDSGDSGDGGDGGDSGDGGDNGDDGNGGDSGDDNEGNEPDREEIPYYFRIINNTSHLLSSLTLMPSSGTMVSDITLNVNEEKEYEVIASFPKYENIGVDIYLQTELYFIKAEILGETIDIDKNEKIITVYKNDVNKHIDVKITEKVIEDIPTLGILTLGYDDSFVPSNLAYNKLVYCYGNDYIFESIEYEILSFTDSSKAYYGIHLIGESLGTLLTNLEKISPGKDINFGLRFIEGNKKSGVYPVGVLTPENIDALKNGNSIQLLGTGEGPDVDIPLPDTGSSENALFVGYDEEAFNQLANLDSDLTGLEFISYGYSGTNDKEERYIWSIVPYELEPYGEKTAVGTWVSRDDLNKIINAVERQGYDEIHFRVKFHKPEMKEIGLPVGGLYIGSLNINRILPDGIISIIGPFNEK